MIRRAVFAALAAGAILGSAGTASAQPEPSQLVDASPGIDAVVVRSPEDVALSFRVALADLRVRLIHGSEVVSDSIAAIEGSYALAAVEADGAGSYLVDWKGTDTRGNPVAGAYAFLVDPRGTGSIAVEREIAGASGALGGMRVLAAGSAALAVVALLATAAVWARANDSRSASRGLAMAVALTALSAFAAGATYGVASDGSPADLVDVSILRSTAASIPGRTWLAAALTMGMMPFLLILSRTVRSRWVPIGALVVGLMGAMWVSVGLSWLLRLPWPLMATTLALAVVVWVSSTEGRPMIVAAAVVAAIAILIPVVLESRGAGTSSAEQQGGFLIEASLDPARSGVNELHIYGFDVSGRGASLGATTVTAYHPLLGVGPLALPVVRAGPNHFLSYHAMLPLTGAWSLWIGFETTDGGSEEVLMDLELQ